MTTVTTAVTQSTRRNYKTKQLTINPDVHWNWTDAQMLAPGINLKLEAQKLAVLTKATVL